MEERLFERRRDLFADLSLVFMDTTTLSFHGAGGVSLGAHGHSKDHRPDLCQMVLAVVLDGEGRSVCTEMLAGNTADMTVLLPMVDRLRKRFGIGRVCVVADRGMISAATISAATIVALEERGLDYVLGARGGHGGGPRDCAEERDAVCAASDTRIKSGHARAWRHSALPQAGDGPWRALRRVPQRGGGGEGPGRRQAIVATLEKRLSGGDKALIGNAGYRRYLRRTGTGKAFEIDTRKLAKEAPFDGIFVLRTNATQCGAEVQSQGPGRIQRQSMASSNPLAAR